MSAWKGLSILAALLLLAPVVSADSFFEDFLSKEYCDEANTTGWWDTIIGEIKPWNLNPYEASGFPLPAQVEALAKSGNYLFASISGLDQITVFDVSDPFSIMPVITLPPTPDPHYDLEVHGNVLFATENTVGFRVYDISDPTFPIEMDVFPWVEDARRLEIYGDRLYIAGGIDGLHVYDISDPFSPTFIGDWHTPGLVVDLAVTGEYLYLAVEGEGFYILDNPASGIFNVVGSEIDAMGFIRIEVNGDRLYAGDYIGDLRVFDISEPTLPMAEGIWSSGGAALKEIKVDGNIVYACGDLGVYAIDAADPYAPQLLAHYTGVSGLSLLPYGEFMFVGTYWDGVVALGMSQRVEPIYGGELNYGHATGVYNIDYQGEYAYVANGGMQILDISDPWNPAWRGSVGSGGIITSVAVDGDYAYIPAWGSGLEVYDISNPDAPNLEALVPWLLCHATAIAKDGDYAYVMAWEGLKVYDVSDPLSPYEVAYLIGGWTGWHDIKLAGDYAYVSMHGGGLVVFDISDPTTPFSAGSYNTIAWEVELYGDYAYLASDTGGVEVLDITDPTNIQHLNYVSLEHPAMALNLAGNELLVSTMAPGMAYLDLTDPAMPAVIPGLDLSGNDYGGSWEISDYGGFFYMGVDSVGLVHRQLFEFEIDKINVEFISEPLTDGPETIEKLRFDIEEPTWGSGWSISTGDGTGFEEVEPGGDWKIVLPGVDLRWKCVIPPEVLLGGLPSSCAWLDLSWLYQEPIIQTVTDVPNDEGLFIDVTWQRSSRDFEGETEPMIHYEVWRRSSDEFRWAWTSLAGIDAAAQDTYTVTVPTLGDSTAHEEGLFVYRVTGHLTDPLEFFESPPDSGRSVDNIVPPPPSSFHVAYHPYDGNTLTWGESEAPDLLFYTIYRDTIPDFQPSSENILQLSFDLEMVDDAGEDWNRVYYKISATDDAWQESEYLSPEVTDAEAPPAQFALYQNLPNPFNPTTKIMFEVPTSGGHVKLSVFDVSGRLLRVLKDEHYGAGRYEAEWNGRDTRGNALPSGVYFYRLESEDFSATKKMVLVK